MSGILVMLAAVVSFALGFALGRIYHMPRAERHAQIEHYTGQLGNIGIDLSWPPLRTPSEREAVRKQLRQDGQD